MPRRSDPPSSVNIAPAIPPGALDVRCPGYTAGILAAESPRLERLAADRAKRRRIRRDLERAAKQLLDAGILAPEGPPPGRSGVSAALWAGPVGRAVAALEAAKRAIAGKPSGDAGAGENTSHPPAEPPAARRLDNTTPNVSQSEEDLARVNDDRRTRYRLKKGAEKVTKRRRVQWCGNHQIRETVDLCVSPEGRAGFQGVMRCGNRWICPDCMARIGLQDAGAISDLCERHAAAGGDLAFMTLTLPHDYGDSLERLRKLTAGAWRRILQGKGWQETKAQFGIIGTVRSLEVTHGAAGFHPHLHVLILTQKQISKGDLEAIRRYIFRHWKAHLTGRGIRPPRPGLCPISIGRQGVAEYISKLGVALELARPDKKKGRRGGRTPLQILNDYTENQNPRDLAIWREWEAAMRGARAITWTRGLRELYGIPKRSDTQNANLEDETATCALELDGYIWARIRKIPESECAVKEAAERGFRAGGLSAAADEAAKAITQLVLADEANPPPGVFRVGWDEYGPPADGIAA